MFSLQPPLFLSLLLNICKPHRSLFFLSQPSTQYYLLAELFALLTVTFSWRLWCNATGSYWKAGWRCQHRIVFLSLFAYRPCTHITMEMFTSQAKYLHEVWDVLAQFYSPAVVFTDVAVLTWCHRISRACINAQWRSLKSTYGLTFDRQVVQSAGPFT